MPTLTVYPNAHPESTSVDGSVHRSFFAFPWTTWADLVVGAGTGMASGAPNDPFITFKSRSSTEDKWQTLRRSIFLFDISSIPTGATISSAIFSVFGNFKSTGAGSDPDINLYSTNPASDTDLIASDYGTFGSIPFSTVITYAGFDISGFNDFALNAAGMSALNTAVNGDGILRLGLRNANYDVAAIEPPRSNLATSVLQGYYAEHAVAEERPKLVITYTANFPTHALTRVTGIIHRYFKNAPDPHQKYSLTCVLGGISVFSASPWSTQPSGIKWPWDRWGAVTAPPWAGDPEFGRLVPPWAGDPEFGRPAPSPPWFPQPPSPAPPDIPEPPDDVFPPIE